MPNYYYLNNWIPCQFKCICDYFSWKKCTFIYVFWRNLFLFLSCCVWIQSQVFRIAKCQAICENSPRESFYFSIPSFYICISLYSDLVQKELWFCPWGQGDKTKEVVLSTPAHSGAESPQEASRLSVHPGTLRCGESPGGFQTECPFTSAQFPMTQTPVCLLICQLVWHLLCEGWMGCSHWHLLWTKKEEEGRCCWVQPGNSVLFRGFS